MLDATYAVLVERTMLMTWEEQQQSLDNLDDSLEGLDFEWETGLPAIARHVPSAEEMYPDVE